MIPKLTLLALYRISFVTSFSSTPNTLAAVAVWISLPSRKAAHIFGSPLMAATIRSSICE
jgi:hypothetical protein